MSLPSRERGLKYRSRKDNKSVRWLVAPRAGAWIEIAIYAKIINVKKSLPSRERGLK